MALHRNQNQAILNSYATIALLQLEQPRSLLQSCKVHLYLALHRNQKQAILNSYPTIALLQLEQPRSIHFFFNVIRILSLTTVLSCFYVHAVGVNRFCPFKFIQLVFWLVLFYNNYLLFLILLKPILRHCN